MNLWIAALIYTAFDYLGYGIVQDERRNAPIWFRIIQAVLVAALTAWLKLGWWDLAAGFTLWWFFVLDWGYYGFTRQPWMKRVGTRLKATDIGRWLQTKLGLLTMNWDDWSDTQADFANGIAHAWWTPYGLVYAVRNGWEKATPIPGLVMQGVIGLALTILIQMTD